VKPTHLHRKTDGERRQNRGFEIAALAPSRWIVMMRRAIVAFATLMALSQTATAGVPLFGHVSCAVVRFYVAKYSEAAAEKWARGHGAGDAEIETARRCLHGANVQTASLTAKSQVPAPVTEQERAQHEPAVRDPDQDALHVVPVQAQRADPEQDKVINNEAGVRVASNPVPLKDIEDRSAEHVSNEIKNDLAPSDGKTAILRPRHLGPTHRAHVPWLKRLWVQLTRPRQFRVAFLHFRTRRF
jgi:hypothetical protein